MTRAFRNQALDSGRGVRPTTLSMRLAISIGLSRKGLYRLAKTLATQLGMTNKWLKDQGLISVKELWVKIHYPATAR
jgi:RNA-directed DNA polymerase